MVRLNLDLGDTIWLNPSRKLLGYNKFFFVSFERMPKRVFDEFKHHSHTHPNYTYTSSSVTHTQYVDCVLNTCPASGATSHGHRSNLASGNSHSHSVTLSFGSASLGSPNWWEHTHSISLVTFDSGGGSHTHTINTPSDGSGCEKYSGGHYCYEYVHTHGTTGLSCGSGGTSHTHTIPSVSTGNSSSGQTPLSHSHSLSFNVNTGDSHVHGITGTLTASTCHFSASTHTHATGVNTDTKTHIHSLSGDTPLGGEAIIPTVTTQDATNVERY